MRVTILVKDKENVPLSRFFDTSLLMRDIASYMRGSTIRKIRDGIEPTNSPLTRTVKGNSLTLRDRGQLTSSITAKSTHNAAIIGTNHPGAPVHNPEDGRTETVLRPTKAKFLWIPASRETRTMQRRFGFDPTSCMKGMKEAGYRIAFVPSKKKSGEKVVLATPPASGKGKSETARDAFPIFLLKKEVTIPARHFLYADERDEKQIESFIDRFYLGER